MRTRGECLRLQKVAAEILTEFPEADFRAVLDEAIKRGESFDNAHYCAVVAMFG
jgi:hypothetical protein